MLDLTNSKFADKFKTRDGHLAVYVGRDFERFGDVICTVFYVEGTGEVTYKKLTGECIVGRGMPELDLVEKID